VLEGPSAAVEVIFERIQRDERHGDATVLGFGPAAGRSFDRWSMAFVGTSIDDVARYDGVATETGYDPSRMTGGALFGSLHRLVLEEEAAASANLGFVTPSPAAAPPSLSCLLRARTAPLHRRIEALLRLPGAVRDRDGYIAWLGRILGCYEPLERSLVLFPEWEALGVAVPSRWHTRCLVSDLAGLGAEPDDVPRMQIQMVPDLPTFAHALGALYVLEGATLGGSVILRDLEARIGSAIAGATSFFGGRGDAVGPMWRSFQAALDGFGREQPQRRPDVVIGGERTFQAMLDWFSPFCAAAGDRP